MITTYLAKKVQSVNNKKTLVRVESINFFSAIKDINDIFEDNMYVSVNFENGRNYVVFVETPKSLLKLMKNKKSDFLFPKDPIVICNH